MDIADIAGWALWILTLLVTIAVIGITLLVVLDPRSASLGLGGAIRAAVVKIGTFTRRQLTHRS